MNSKPRKNNLDAKLYILLPLLVGIGVMLVIIFITLRVPCCNESCPAISLIYALSLFMLALLVISPIVVYIALKRAKFEQLDNQRLQTMIESIPLGCCITDDNYNVLDCNNAMVALFGLKNKEEYKQRFFDLSPEYQPCGELSKIKFSKLIEQTFEGGRLQFEWMHQTLDGEPIPVEVLLVYTVLDGKPVKLGYIRDLRDFNNLRELQDEQRKREIAEESNRAKTMFIANMSHEIRTPMNSILGYSELAMKDAAPGTKIYLNKIVTNSKWLIDIINDVLDISKIESGLLEIEEIPFDIPSLIERCQSLVSPSAAEKDLRLSINTKPFRLNKRRLIGDPTKICQICTNILFNGIKFTDAGAVAATFFAKEQNDNNFTLIFESRDTGIGMTEEQMTRIFDPFVQADSSTTRKYGGSGLGLTIAKRLVEAMGGELTVQSAFGFGSKFTIAIPLSSIADEEGIIEHIERNKPLPKPRFQGGEVLVVDDNDMNLGVACEHLRQVGLNPTIAMTGIAAIAKVQERIENNQAPYDLILMDIHMPEMDGKEAAKAIKALNVKTPIIAMTAEAFKLTGVTRYGDFGMTGYLNKPFTSQEIWRCLLKYLNSKVRHNGPGEVVQTHYEPVINEELLQELKALFLKGNRDTAKNINLSLEQGNIKEAHRLVHTLKSSALLIGENHLGYIASEAESRLKLGGVLRDEQLNELTAELSRVLMGLDLIDIFGGESHE